jgi:drug/metabolite transporter (DMT)-like permease
MATSTTTDPTAGGPSIRPPRTRPSARRLLVVGLLLAAASAATFGTAGAVAKSLLVQGWSPAAAVTLRILIGALVLMVPAVVSMRGRWHLLRRPATLAHVGIFGGLAVAGCQLFYFLAVEQLSVGVALMLEYLGPILVVAWLWLVHGQKPRVLTVAGVGLAVVGLLLVLDVLGDVQVNTAGVVWGLLAAIGLAVFFIVGADESNGLPPVAFSAFGMAVGAVALALAGLLRIVPFRVSDEPVTLAGAQLPWWVPVLWLGIVAAAFAYVAGIAANRRLGAKVASFVGLTEVMFAVLWAWLLLGELPATVQLLGGLLILAGVAAVKADERPGEPHPEVEPLPGVDAQP